MNNPLEEIARAYSADAETTLPQRFNAIIDHVTPPTRRWKELEDKTGIATHSWRQAYLGKQRPTAEMLEAVSRHWPKYAFWLMTGITNIEASHTCPPGSHPWPSKPEELDDFDDITDGPWLTLMELKTMIGQIKVKKPMLPAEERTFNARMNTLATRLMADDVFKRVIYESWLKRKGKS